MTIQASGQISFDNLRAEFAQPVGAISLNAYHRNAGIVGAGAPNVPLTLGAQISLSHFYGAANGFSFGTPAAPINIPNGTMNYNLRAAAIAAGWDGVAPLWANVLVPTGAVVGSNSTGTPAFVVDGSYPVGSTIVVTNNGTIVGRGGAGGSGAATTVRAYVNGTAGGNGGIAFSTIYPVTLYNNGVISGGGGGGVGGGTDGVNTCGNGSGAGGGAGGGGGFGTAGLGSTSGGAYTTTGTPGAVGGALVAGAKGMSTTIGGWLATQPGTSGSYASAGTGNGYSFPGGTGGGLGGACTAGNANITWAAIGTRYGALN